MKTSNKDGRRARNHIYRVRDASLALSSVTVESPSAYVNITIRSSSKTTWTVGPLRSLTAHPHQIPGERKVRMCLRGSLSEALGISPSAVWRRERTRIDGIDCASSIRQGCANRATWSLRNSSHVRIRPDHAPRHGVGLAGPARLTTPSATAQFRACSPRSSFGRCSQWVDANR